jgi:hypothetical protein
MDLLRVYDNEEYGNTGCEEIREGVKIILILAIR